MDTKQARGSQAYGVTTVGIGDQPLIGRRLTELQELKKLDTVYVKPRGLCNLV